MKFILKAIAIGIVCVHFTVNAAVMTFENPTRITVNDGSFTSATSTIAVTGVVGAVTKVTVQFDVFNSGVFDDYDFKLRAPNMEEVLIISDIGHFGSFGGGVTFIVDDDFPAFPRDITRNLKSSFTGRVTDHPGIAIGDSDPPILGGPGDLSKFNGADPNGDWLFIAIDDRDQSAINPIGQFENIKIHITTVPEPSSFVITAIGILCLTLRRVR